MLINAFLLTKPNGDMRRQMDTDKMRTYGFEREYTLQMGLTETIEYYEELQK